MNELFSAKNRVFRALDAGGKREFCLLTFLTAAAFLASAFGIWDFSFDLCNMIGAIVSGTPSEAVKQLIRKLPVILLSFTYVYMSVFLHCVGTAPSAERRIRGWKANGFVCAIIGTFIAAFTLTGVAVGNYGKLVEGFPTKLFPLNCVIDGLLVGGLGAVFVLYAGKLKEKGTRLPFGKPKRFGRGFRGVFRTLSFLLGACGFAACVHAFRVMDFTHGNVFFNVTLWLNYFTAALMIGYWKFVYHGASDEAKPRLQRFGAAFFLIANAILIGLYLLALTLQNEAPNQNAFGLLPIEFTASFHAFIVLYGANNLLAPLIALLKTFLPGKKAA